MQLKRKYGTFWCAEFCCHNSTPCESAFPHVSQDIKVQDEQLFGHELKLSWDSQGTCLRDLPLWTNSLHPLWHSRWLTECEDQEVVWFTFVSWCRYKCEPQKPWFLHSVVCKDMHASQKPLHHHESHGRLCCGRSGVEVWGPEARNPQPIRHVPHTRFAPFKLDCFGNLFGNGGCMT